MSYFRCPECHEPNTSEHWDAATQRVFGPDCISIEDKLDNGEVWFICPACEEQLDTEDIEEEEESVESNFQLIVQTGFIDDSTRQVQEMVDCLLGGGECKTKDLLTAQAVETIMLVNNLTYVKNVYFDKGERVFDFQI